MKKIQLKTKLLLISGGMVFLFGLIVLIQFEQGLKKQRSNNTKSFTLYSDSLSKSISQAFYSQYNSLEAFSKNSFLIKYENKEKIKETLNDIVEHYPMNDLLIISDMDGNFISSSTLSESGEKLNTNLLLDKNFSEKKWFIETSNEIFTENKEKKITGVRFGQPEVDSIVSEVYGSKRYGTHFSTVLKNEYGDNVGILTAFVNFKWVEDELVSLYQSLKFSGKDDASIYVINSEGSVLTELGKNDKSEYTILDSIGTNLYASNNEVVKFLKNNEKGSVETENFKSNTQELYAFEKIDKQRFVDSIGWSVIVGIDPNIVFSDASRLRELFYWTFGVMLSICLIISYFFSTQLYRKLLDVTSGLKESFGRTSSLVGDLQGMSANVSDMSTQQASAIQETASTLDEVSQMVKMSAQNAERSVEVAKSSENNANEGKKIVSQVLESMNEIKISNDEILEQTTDSNKKFNDIVKVINEISEKTQVINDIVFQTKLLSFNASVEAARAGEHGKGFAVVAEEIGSLAQMSGKAANEISGILSESISTVEKIVSDSQSGIERIMIKSKNKIEEGISISGKCDSALDSITEDVKQVAIMAEEISTATREQEQGVSQIAEAMNQLQEATHKNSEISDNTLNCSKKLNEESTYLDSIVKILENEVTGKKNQVLNTKKEVKKIATKNTKKIRPKSKKEENVLAFEKRNVATTLKSKPDVESVKVVAKTQTSSIIEKKVVGSDIPLSDDPRFEDI